MPERMTSDLLDVPALGEPDAAEAEPLGVDTVLDALGGGAGVRLEARVLSCSDATAPAMTNALMSSATGARSVMRGLLEASRA